MLKNFENFSADGPETRRGLLAFKYFNKWKSDHLAECLVILRNDILNDFTNVCHSNQKTALTSCQELKSYFNNNCTPNDDESQVKM